MKRYLFIIILFVLLFPLSCFAEDRITGEYGDYDQTIKNIQEVMRDYYIRGRNIQYNYSRARYGADSPEESTIQDHKHFVCASFTYTAHVEAFGVSDSYDHFPIYNYSITNAGANYYNSNKNNPSQLDGHYLIYYEKKADSVKYVYGGDDTISNFAQQIQPGDLFTYTGHAMIAYDVVEKTPGNWDVLMLQSGGGALVRTRIAGTSKIYQSVFPSSYDSLGYFNVPVEGTVKFFWFSANSKLTKNGKINCQKEECTVVRPFYKGENNKSIFNFGILPSNYQKSVLRTQYPGLHIEKIVNKIDNNSVYLNDELEYTITITNKSNSTGNGENYGSFYVVENIGDYVDYISSDGTFHDQKVEFYVEHLNVGNSVQLKYKVKVKEIFDNIGQDIVSEGVFKKNLEDDVFITTGVVQNTIIRTTTHYNKTYQECYDEYKENKTGLELIDSIYQCAYHQDFHFNEFQFSSLFKKKIITSKGASNAIVFQSSLDDQYTMYKNMILNKLWSGIVELDENSTNDGDSASDEDEDEVETYTLPRWSGDVASTRARNIHQDFFKDGDVLIYSVNYSNTPSSLTYTKESGVYAYIFLDGKFIGINGSGNTERNQFTYQYYIDQSLDISSKLFSGYANLTDENRDYELTIANYSTLFDKDYYVIFRPELVIQELYKVEVSQTPSKVIYHANDNSIEVYGGELTKYYNDGTFDVISMTQDDIVFSGNIDSEGQQSITLNYLGYTTSFETNVIIDAPQDTPEEQPEDHPKEDIVHQIVSVLDTLAHQPIIIYGIAIMMIVMGVIFADIGKKLNFLKATSMCSQWLKLSPKNM